MGRPPRIDRDQLLQTAQRFFTTKGFAATTLADIAGELSVTPAAILRHVDSKQALFAEAMSTVTVDPPACILDLATTDASADPRPVLRRIAKEFVPFARGIIASRIVVEMHERAHPAIVLPFRPDDASNPARRGIPILIDYFRRACAAGTIRIDDPQAAALLFIGSLHSYIIFHELIRLTPVYPLDKYIDALLDLWTNGGIGNPEGGTVGPREKKSGSNRDSDRRAVRSGSRSVAVRARDKKAKADDPVGNNRGKDGPRRVAGGRPRRR
jgi:AcrR family transcriptional regulator